MSEQSNLDREAKRRLMSSLADGDAAAADAAQASALWARDAESRDAWHTYHLIGDALRSDDLAVRAERDEAFLQAFRQRLAAEPIVLSPQPAVAATPDAVSHPAVAGSRAAAGRRGWRAPVAVAASVVAVAGVVATMRTVSPGAEGAGQQMVSAPARGPSGAGPTLVADQLGDPQWRVVDGKLIRDARLDSYLRAHRGGALAMPGGATGRFETVVLER